MTSSQEEDHAKPNGNHSPSPENDLGNEIERLPDNQEFTFDLLPEICLHQISSFPFHQSQCLLKHRDDFTLSTWYNEGLNVENTALPNIPKFDSSAGILMHDLSFMDQDDRTTIGTRGGTTEFDALPSRTTVVAQFLQGTSTLIPISEDTGDLILNIILEGKTKKYAPNYFCLKYCY
ncbi:hypothetical protein FXO37_33711 [Capsicum annuum]|nr:hypothetical protein FXO37_33711 [Capsicum annuum]